jgi:hypothetical protein
VYFIEILLMEMQDKITGYGYIASQPTDASQIEDVLLFAKEVREDWFPLHSDWCTENTSGYTILHTVASTWYETHESVMEALVRLVDLNSSHRGVTPLTRTLQGINGHNIETMSWKIDFWLGHGACVDNRTLLALSDLKIRELVPVFFSKTVPWSWTRAVRPPLLQNAMDSFIEQVRILLSAVIYVRPLQDIVLCFSF